MKFPKNSFYVAAGLSLTLMLGGCSIFGDGSSSSKPSEGPDSAGDEAIVQAVQNAIRQKNARAVEDDPEAKALHEDIEKLQAEKAKIDTKIAVANAELEKELLPKRTETTRLTTLRATRAAEFQETLSTINQERVGLERRLALATAQANARLREKQLKAAELELEKRELKVSMDELGEHYSVPVAIADKKKELSSVAVSAQPKYLKEPLVAGTLYISDRRIDLNGPIMPENAQEVVRQINFFNNKNTEYPIFLVITNSPGGSVSAGYQIQKAMQSSVAPVYVVVKGMAASMAAVIAATAERSYCYANTMILHHQISRGISRANLTVLRETVGVSEKWYEIFATPVAKKMGVSLKDFTAQMYEHNSEGNWSECGTEAQKLKWIDYVVDRIEDTAVVSLADATVAATPTSTPTHSREKTDPTTGTRYVDLPPLSNPMDCWWIYDNRGYYRAH